MSQEPPHHAQHALVDAGLWLVDKIIDLAPLWVVLLVLWVLTDGLVYLETKTDFLGRFRRSFRKVLCRIEIHDWGHFTDGDFCYWCSKRKSK